MGTYTPFPPIVDPYHSQTAYDPYHGYAAIAPALHNSPRPILEDDRKLFDNLDRFLQGEIDQEKFQAGYCKRLLFTWEWVLNFCFLNYNQALETWYQLLRETGDEDIWLWVDGDEQQSQKARLISPSRENPTDLHPSCALSKASLGQAIKILRDRSQHHQHPAYLPSWHQRLDSCGKPHLRLMAVAFAIATSVPLRALDRDRGVRDRTVYSLLEDLRRQLPDQETTEAQRCQWQNYLARLREAGHDVCTEAWMDESDIHCALFELVDITNPDSQVQLPIHWPGCWYYYKSDMIKCAGCSEGRPLLLDDISWRAQAGNPEALAAEIPHTFTPKKFICLLWWLWATWQLETSKNHYILADVDTNEWFKWLKLLTLQPTADIREHGVNHQAVHGLTRVIRHLLSKQMEESLQSDTKWKRLLQKRYSDSNICGFSSLDCPGYYTMCKLSSGEWKTAEDIFSGVTAAWYGNNDFVDVQSVCGVLAWWASNSGVTSNLPNYYHFFDKTSFLYERTLSSDSQSTSLLQEKLRARVLNDKPECCPDFYQEYLDCYLTCGSLLLPKYAIWKELVWGCKCRRIDGEDAIRVFKKCLINIEEYEDDSRSNCWALLDRMIDTAEDLGFKHPYIKERKRFSEWDGVEDDDQSENGSEGDEESKDNLALRPDTLTTNELEAYAKAISQELAKRSAVAAPPPPARSLPPNGKRNPSKSWQAESIKKYLIILLQDPEAPPPTRSIVELKSCGKQKLPWKNLPQVLQDKGYGFENWPEGVPKPGSGSARCDENKGIHGLNADDIRTLYNATQSKDCPLRLRKVGEGVSAQTRMEERVRKGEKRRRDREVDVEVMEAGPSKRSKPGVEGYGSGERDR